MTTREIVQVFEEMYGVEVSPTLISKVTDAVLDQVIQWQSRSLDIESLNSIIRRVTKKRKTFPSNASAMKVIYLAIQDASKRWTMSIRDWKEAPNYFMIVFEERLTNVI